MVALFNHKFTRYLLVFLSLLLFTVTVEMRPGRVYFILQMLLFQNSVLSLLLFLAMLSLTVAGQLLFILNRSKQVRKGYFILLFPFLSISLSYRFITGYNYSYLDAHTVLNNLNFFGAAVQNYTLAVFGALVGTWLTIYVLNKLSRKVEPIFRPWHTLFFIPIAALGLWYTNRSLGIVDDLPAFYRVPLSTALAASHELPVGQRGHVSITPDAPVVRHLFMVVDESITGSSLSLNGNPVATTPYLAAHPEAIVNFGIATAYTNYSAGSNIALMGGAQMRYLPDKEKRLLTSPSVFQYAKRAGYTTYYIDAQIGGKSLQNYMSLQDLESIDHFIQPADLAPDLPYHLRDHWVADLLVKLSKGNGKTFAYVTKAGAHWPYARTYPPDSAIFKPVLNERSMLKDRLRSLNTYHNSIRWSVDQFWKKLIEEVQPSDSTFMLYTSDHGQDLSGDGISIVHASTVATNPIEANVPLWYLDKTGLATPFTSKGFQDARKHHQQIFPTLLLLMGYQPQDIRPKYGETIFEANSDTTRYFLTGDIFGRGSTQVVPFDRTP